MVKWVKASVLSLYTLMMLLIMVLLLFFFPVTEFACKRVFLLPQWAMLLLGTGVLGAAIWLAMRSHGGRARDHAPVRAVFWLGLLLVQLAFCYFSYFLTGWDAGMMLEYAHWMGVYDIVEVNNFYYSMHPNNVLITMIFAGIMRGFKFIVGGEPGIERCAFAVIAVQCVINTMTGALCQSIARRWTKSEAFSWMVAGTYAVFVGLSPWLMIPYTDSFSLIFPVLILWLYQRWGDRKAAAWIGIGLLSGIGYLIKPQTAIVTIALVIIEGAKLIARRGVKCMLLRLGSMLLSAALMVGPFFDAVVKRSGFELDAQLNIGALHFAMMGLNRETNGGFSAEDEHITLAALDKAGRTEIQLQEIRKRLEAFGPQGLLEHLKKKMLTNYADGTFAWGVEGQFFDRLIEDKHPVISPLLKRWIYPDENGDFSGFATVQQCIWLALLLGGLLSLAAYGAMKQDVAQYGLLLVMMLSVIGLTAFELIFEARARYLLAYAPIYILLGIGGLWYGIERIRAGAGRSAGSMNRRQE
ncbi:MAG: hypothetical protein J6M56_03710 [Clostridia bacterium]|nr:hypothetical protein [Clostridia bacterium]